MQVVVQDVAADFAQLPFACIFGHRERTVVDCIHRVIGDVHPETGLCAVGPIRDRQADRLGEAIGIGTLLAIVVDVVQQLIAVTKGARVGIKAIERQLTIGGIHHAAHQIGNRLACRNIQGGARNGETLDIVQAIAVANAEGT